MAKLLLHLGVHKTASTHLQATFKANKADLDAKRIWYQNLDKFRPLFTLPYFQLGNRNSEEGAAFLSRVFKFRNTALFSDENIIGLLGNILAGKFYPSFNHRVRRLVKITSEVDDVRFFISFRNYASWIESAYLQSLRKNAVISFGQLTERLDLAKISWLGLFGKMQDILHGRALTVWPYELYANESAQVVRLFEKELGVMLPRQVEARSNPAYSDVALKMLLATASEIRDEDLAPLHAFLKERFTVKHGYPRPSLLDEKTRALLTSRYLEDMQAIQRIAKPNVTLVGFDNLATLIS